METQYIRMYSQSLGRDMECKVYGHAGRPVLFIPCQNGRFFDFENFHMTDVWVPWIESGQVMVFSIDTMDEESWSNKAGDPRWRIDRHEQWMRYITEETVPFIRSMANAANGWSGEPG
ncbi:MAG: esterase, partial [Clostridia bacterium]|nr:esterase [Clostridia bacterium]